jgi:hypothetical protein
MLNEAAVSEVQLEDDYESSGGCRQRVVTHDEAAKVEACRNQGEKVMTCQTCVLLEDDYCTGQDCVHERWKRSLIGIHRKHRQIADTRLHHRILSEQDNCRS